MARPEEYDRLDVIKAARQGRGKTTVIAHILGCSAETVRNYAKRYKTVANAIEEARQTFKTGLADKAELKLEEAVMDGKAWAVRYALSTQGKDRGYTERSEQQVALQASVDSNVEYGVDGDTAESIFDILASVGALQAGAGDAEDDEIHSPPADS